MPQVQIASTIGYAHVEQSVTLTLCHPSHIHKQVTVRSQHTKKVMEILDSSLNSDTGDRITRSKEACKLMFVRLSAVGMAA